MSDLQLVKEVLTRKGFRENDPWASQILELLRSKELTPFDKEEFKDLDYNDLEVFCYYRNVSVDEKEKLNWLNYLSNNGSIKYFSSIEFEIIRFDISIYHLKEPDDIRIEFVIESGMDRILLNMLEFCTIFTDVVRDIRLNQILE